MSGMHVPRPGQGKEVLKGVTPSVSSKKNELVILNKIIDILVKENYIDFDLQLRAELNRDTSLSDLGLDSLDLVDVIMEIEEEFGIRLPEDIEDIKTLGDWVDVVNEAVSEKK